ncbi:NAD(P)H-binding protein [Spongiivirga sp. MCCC 1A20706]|uniref:NAD(P)-dependent oxidoreductase n=1 Tax=Spongiivirga sp. MCCC 1A20706 TaxID=3160963 RepID=UPI0039779600
MKILLLGATGRTGKLVLEKALEKGHRVHCLSRNSQRLTTQNGLKIFEGDPSKSADLEKAISGCNAIISVLNISRTSDFPWSKLRTPATYLSEVMQLLIPIAEKEHINRISICSAWGVADSRKDIPKWFRWFIDNSNIGVAYEDHHRQEKIIVESNLDWTIVRPVGLMNAKRTEKIKETFENKPKPSLLISRKSVATYLLDSLNRTDLVQKKVVISKK